MTELSIIIVTYRGWMRLDKCLFSLAAFSGALSIEVIIVDNTPDKDEISPIMAKYPSFTYLHNNINGGYGYANNKGVEHSSGKYLLILNPDTVAGESAVTSLLVVVKKHPEFAIVSCRQVNEKGRECNVMSSLPEFRNLTGLIRSVSGKKSFPADGEFIFPGWVSGSVMLMSKERFNALGGFDDDYWMYFEDVDICKRARDSGGKVVLLQNVSIEHNHGGSSRIDLRTASLTKTEVHISRHVYFSKHRKGLQMVAIQGFLVLNNLVTNFLLALPGLLFFFIPKIFIRALIFRRLVSYYLIAAAGRSWISPRSVNNL